MLLNSRSFCYEFILIFVKCVSSGDKQSWKLLNCGQPAYLYIYICIYRSLFSWKKFHFGMPWTLARWDPQILVMTKGMELFFSFRSTMSLCTLIKRDNVVKYIALLSEVLCKSIKGDGWTHKLIIEKYTHLPIIFLILIIVISWEELQISASFYVYFISDYYLNDITPPNNKN